MSESLIRSLNEIACESRLIFLTHFVGQICWSYTTTWLSDVSVSHTLTPAGVASLKSQASVRQSAKKSKYASVASRLGAELLNVVVDTSGGMTADALRLIQAVGEEGEKWSAGTWTSAAIRRHLTGAVAIGLQRGNAIAMLSGYSRTARVGAREDGTREEKVGAGERKEWGGE